MTHTYSCKTCEITREERRIPVADIDKIDKQYCKSCNHLMRREFSPGDPLIVIPANMRAC
jgi:predicted Zn-dependent protease